MEIDFGFSELKKIGFEFDIHKIVAEVEEAFGDTLVSSLIHYKNEYVTFTFVKNSEITTDDIISKAIKYIARRK